VEVAATGAGMASTTVPRATPAATGGGAAGRGLRGAAATAASWGAWTPLSPPPQPPQKLQRAQPPTSAVAVALLTVPPGALSTEGVVAFVRRERGRWSGYHALR
jgi:hypothetical protein